MSRLRRLALGFATVVLTAFSSGLHAQETPSCPSSKTLAELIQALDAAISGPADKDRTCLRALLRPNATLTAMVDNAGVLKPVDFTLDEWIERVKKRGSTPLYEHQVKFVSETYGSIAHLWSMYEIRDTPEGAAKTRGVNSIQAMTDGAEWKVVEILWQAETPSNPIPSQLLPK
jgi:hypothetical protein